MADRIYTGPVSDRTGFTQLASELKQVKKSFVKKPFTFDIMLQS